MSGTRRRLLVAACLFLPGLAAVAEEPLSAIDWLSQSVATPAALPRGSRPVITPAPGEPPVSSNAGTRPITTTPLGAQGLDGLGLVPASRVGLPRTLWGGTPGAVIAEAIARQPTDTLPAIQALLMALMTAELAPPADSDGRGTVFLARVDKLLDMGALDPALAMLELPQAPQPEPFRRWFDVALLLGEEDRACTQMRKTPQVGPTFPARIFCLARGGDWNAAALSLRTGETLGRIDPDMAALLSRFLDPDLADGAPPLPAPARPSPLILRLMEAIGEPIPTARLPVAFAQADLRANTGWKARIEAGERLARTGALDPNALLGLYTEQKPAASGGVWDRVRAVQDFDAALGSGDGAAVARALPVVWERLSAVELEVPFATIYGERLAGLGLTGEAGRTAWRVGLLSPAYETVARGHKPEDAAEAFLADLARGRQPAAAPDAMGEAIRSAFAADAALPADLAAMVGDKRLGEAILAACLRVSDGMRGDVQHVAEGLALLRAVGLESVARRTALELMLLERRG